MLHFLDGTPEAFFGSTGRDIEFVITLSKYYNLFLFLAGQSDRGNHHA